MNFIVNKETISIISKNRRVLDIGCGNNKHPGSIGIDFSNINDVDISYNLENMPYPIDDNSFDVVILQNVIEHIQDIVGLMEEIHRIITPGGDILISTPHFSSLYSYQDPTHVRHMAYNSMDVFIDETTHLNFYSQLRFKMINKSIDFGKSFPLSYIARTLFTLSNHKYEKHFSFIFPANQLHFHMQAK